MLGSSSSSRRALVLQTLRRRRQHHGPYLWHAAEFHASAKRQVWPFVGLGVLVLATGAQYVVRALRRMREEDERRLSGKHGEASDDVPRPAYVGKGYPVLGLDVGTLQACVAVATGKGVPPFVVENHEGRRTTPSFLTYDDGQLVVGQLAKRGRWRNPSRVIFNAQGLMGVPYNDALRPKYPFPVSSEADSAEEDAAAGGEEGSAAAKKPSGGKAAGVVMDVAGHRLTPREVAAHVVENLTASAEHKLHQPPGYAVLAVPSYFNKAQKAEAHRAVAEGTGVEAVEVIEDATAALVAAKFSGAMGPLEEEHFDRPWCVVDVGGLVTQISIVSLDPDHGLAVKAHETVETVGGEQLDAALVFHLVQEFKKKHRGLDLGADYLALERLYDAAEATKMELSNRVSSSISLPFITADMTGPKHMDVTLTRSQYEAVVDPVLRRLDDPCAKILRSTNLKPSELQGLLITGGGARMAFVRSYVSKLIQREGITTDMPEEAAALGACFFGRETVEH